MFQILKPCICPNCGTKLHLRAHGRGYKRFLDGVRYVRAKKLADDAMICPQCGSLCIMNYSGFYARYGEPATSLLPASAIQHYSTPTETKLQALLKSHDDDVLYHKYLAHYYEECGNESARQKEINWLLQTYNDAKQQQNHLWLGDHLGEESFAAIKRLEYHGHLIYDVGRNVLLFPSIFYHIDLMRQSGNFEKAAEMITECRAMKWKEPQIAYEQYLAVEEKLIRQRDNHSH